MHTAQRVSSFAVGLLLAAVPARPDDVQVKPAPGDGLVVTDSTGTSERLRVNEDGGVFLPGLPPHPSADKALCSDLATGLVGTCALAPQGPPGPPGAPGLVWRGAWESGTAYAIDDAVSFGGSSYVAIAPSTAQQPDLAPASWSLLALKGAAGPPGPNATQIVCASNSVEKRCNSGEPCPEDFILLATCPSGFSRLSLVFCTDPLSLNLVGTELRNPHVHNTIACKYTGLLDPFITERFVINILCIERTFFCAP
jgi:hypothetical protein